MKILVCLICLFASASLKAQDPSFDISVQGQHLVSTLEEDNEEKSITVTLKDTYTSEDQLLIVNTNWQEEKEWRRTFSLRDANGSDITDIPAINKDGSFCISLKKIAPLLQKGSVYRLYTVALPRDPQKAMLVKVAPRLVCTVKVK